MREQAHEKMKNLTLSAMFAAVIMLMILYLFHIPVGSSGGYVQPPSCRARFEDDGGSSCRRASMKREEGPG